MLVLIMMPVIYSAYFLLHQQLIRYEMWGNIEGTDNVIIMDASSLKWADKDREIVVNGLLFDVKSIEKFGDSVKVTGEYDYEETNLNREMELVEETQEEEDQQSNSIQVLVQVTDDSLSRFLADFFQFNQTGNKCSKAASILPTIYLKTISPPPKS